MGNTTSDKTNIRVYIYIYLMYGIGSIWVVYG